MHEKLIDSLGHRLNDVVMAGRDGNSADMKRTLQEINDAVYFEAMKEAGVNAYDLTDEEQEDSYKIKLYWTYASLNLSKVYMAAAQQLYRNGLDKEI